MRAELETTYGHYAEVRRRTTGVLQALDTGVVSHETIQDTTEEVMVASPRYWLAPALVALAAWSRHDRSLADRALAEALRRDVAKTSLFMSLVLRRYRRPAAARWLAQFFARQDPTALGREFIVVLDAMATGGYGIEGRAIATVEVTAWLKELSIARGSSTSRCDAGARRSRRCARPGRAASTRTWRPAARAGPSCRPRSIAPTSTTG